jgi:hypothetical protein
MQAEHQADEVIACPLCATPCEWEKVDDFTVPDIDGKTRSFIEREAVCPQCSSNPGVCRLIEVPKLLRDALADGSFWNDLVEEHVPEVPHG